jgi:hypothetical protein
MALESKERYCEKQEDSMSIRDLLIKELEQLDEKQLREVEEYVRFLRLQSRLAPPLALTEAEIAKMYGEFAEEDRMLAEEGMADYKKTLSREDKR